MITRISTFGDLIILSRDLLDRGSMEYEPEYLLILNQEPNERTPGTVFGTLIDVVNNNGFNLDASLAMPFVIRADNIEEEYCSDCLQSVLASLESRACSFGNYGISAGTGLYYPKAIFNDPKVSVYRVDIGGGLFREYLRNRDFIKEQEE